MSQLESNLSLIKFENENLRTRYKNLTKDLESIQENYNNLKKEFTSKLDNVNNYNIIFS